MVEQRIPQVGSYPGLDIRHMEGSLKYSGIADNIDILYFNDYTPNCDDALIDYCLQKKPEAVFICLSQISHGRRVGPTPDCLGKITHQLSIPTAIFWFDIWMDGVAELLKRYLHSVTLNLIGGLDASSHKTIPLEGTNYVYTLFGFDESYFDMPEGVRDIPVGFLGKLQGNRGQWIEELKKYGILTYIRDGHPVAGWKSNDEYRQLMSRMKIALNFSAHSHQPILLGDKQRDREALEWVLSQLKTQIKTWVSKLIKNPTRLKHTIPEVKKTYSALSASMKKTRYQVRARVWEALWLRTFLLEEDNPVTSLYFEPYVDYVPFTTLKDLVKIRYYLENDEERDRIRMHGRATIEKYYNARIISENIFEAIGIPSDNQFRHHPGEIWNKVHFDNWFLSASDKTRKDL